MSTATRFRRSFGAASATTLGVLVAALFGGFGQATEIDPAALRSRALSLFQPLPASMPGSSKDTPARVALGQRLFNDTRLSLDHSQSCNSCHRLDGGRAGVDNLPTSPGVKGENGSRNSPTVLNAGLQLAQFWDGRAADLHEQAKGPLLNPVEMAMPDGAAVVARLTADASYPTEFATAFPDESAISYELVAESIAAFERTLISHDRFDEFLQGDEKALRPVELAGLQAFMDNGCTACHSGAGLGGNSFMKLGLVKPYTGSADPGRQALTGLASDIQVFKTPMLRNVALTAPYFHDGQVSELGEAVRLMGEHQLGRSLDADSIVAISAFLGSLSDQTRAPVNLNSPAASP